MKPGPPHLLVLSGRSIDAGESGLLVDPASIDHSCRSGLASDYPVSSAERALGMYHPRHARAEKSAIISILATDAPFLRHQLKRLARCAPLGIVWTGSLGQSIGPKSGAGFRNNPMRKQKPAAVARICPGNPPLQSGHLASPLPSRRRHRPFFDATVKAMGAILNALFANADMTGQGGSFVPTLAHDWLAATFGRTR